MENGLGDLVARHLGQEMEEKKELQLSLQGMKAVLRRAAAARLGTFLFAFRYGTSFVKNSRRRS